MVSYIIGGSSGVGLATAKELVKNGESVVLLGRDYKKLRGSIPDTSFTLYTGDIVYTSK